MSSLEVEVVEAEKRDEGMAGAKIPTGEVFFGEIGGTKGVFLRIYDAIVYLADPNLVWDWSAAGTGPVVYKYRAAETAKLVVS